MVGNLPLNPVSASFPCNPDKTPACPHWKGAHLPVDGSALRGISPPVDVVILDVDLYKGVSLWQISRGVDCLVDWDAAYLQSTPRGGRHYAFLVPAAVAAGIKTGSNVLGIDGLDVRSPGTGYVCTGDGYEVAPCYESAEWALENVSWPQMPASLLEALLQWNQRLTNCGTHSNKRVVAPAPATAGNAEQPDQRVLGIPAYCFPQGAGQRNACILRLARWYKGVSGMADRNELADILRDWWRSARAIVRTKDFSVSLREFRYAYARVLVPTTATLAEATTGWEVEAGPSGSSGDVYKLLSRLQKNNPTSPAHLDMRNIAKIVGTSKSTVARCIKELVAIGLISVHRIGMYFKRLASEYIVAACALWKPRGQSARVSSPKSGSPNEVTSPTHECTFSTAQRRALPDEGCASSGLPSMHTTAKDSSSPVVPWPAGVEHGVAHVDNSRDRVTMLHGHRTQYAGWGDTPAPYTVSGQHEERYAGA